MTTFTTIADAIEYVTVALGEFVSDFDVEGIARDVTEWQDGEFVLVGDVEDFWNTVALYEISDND